MSLRPDGLAWLFLMGLFSLVDTNPKGYTEEPKTPNKAPATKSIQEWINLLRTGTEEERTQSIEALKALKPVPKIILPALIEVVENCRETVSYPALQLIQNLGVEAKEYASTLLRLLKASEENPQKHSFAQEIALTLAKIVTEPILEVTRRMLFCGEGKRGDQAVEFWAYVYRFPVPVTEQILEILRDDEKSRPQAFRHLSHYHEVTFQKEKPLLELVEPKMHLIAKLESLLGRETKFDHQLISLLIPLHPQSAVNHSSIVIRAAEQGDLSLGWMGNVLQPHAKELLPIMIYGAGTSVSHRAQYQYVLAQWPLDIVWPGLQLALRDRNWRIRSGAIRTLQDILPKIHRTSLSSQMQQIRKQIESELVVAMNDENTAVRLEALIQLADFFPERRDRLVRPLIDLFVCSEGEVQWRAIHTLGYLGPTSYAALPVLLQSVTNHKKDFPHGIALEAILSIDVSQSDRILEEIREEFKRVLSNKYDPQRVLKTIQKMGPKGKELSSDLVKAIECQGPHIALMIVDTLDRIAPDQPEFQIRSLRIILKNLSPTDGSARSDVRGVCKRLFRLGEKAKELVPFLEEIQLQWPSDTQAVFSLALFTIDLSSRKKYTREIREALGKGNLALLAALSEFDNPSSIHPHFKELFPLFLETLKQKPELVRPFVNTFEDIGRPMRDFLSELKTAESYLRTPQQKRLLAEYIKELESMKK